MGMFQVVKALWGLKKRAKLTRAQMVAYQNGKLRSLVRHAWSRSSFYRDYYSDHGIREKDLADITVRDLPFTNKELLMEHFDHAVTDARLRKADLEAFIETPMDTQTEYLDRYIVFHTSGSSGNIGIFVHDMASWALYQAGYPARIMNADRSPLRHNRAVFYGATNGRFAGIAVARAQPKLLVTVLILSIQEPIAKIVEALNDFQPTVLGGYASGIAALARQAIAGHLNVNPRMVGTCAETLTEEMYSSIEDAWPKRQTDAYASSECPFVAARLCGQSVYSVHDDVNILELLDDHAQPVAEGQAGNIVLTNLHNRPLPLIRYKMLDMADRGPDQKDGPFSTVTRIHGRVNDALPILLDDGSRGTLSPVVLCGFAAHGLKKAKFVLTSRSQIEVRYMSDHEIDLVVREAFQKVLKASGAANAMRLEVKRVHDLPPDPQTGKFRITEIQT